MQIHEIDLHYHAGQERQHKALREHLAHAVSTGRKILGVTDHYDLYLPGNEDNAETIYPRSIDGLLAYAAELRSLKNEFPSLAVYFAPEIGADIRFSDIPDAVHAVSDYFICEPPAVVADKKENTERRVERLSQIAAFSKRTEKPVFLAHPFRSAVDRRLVKNPIEPAIVGMRTRASISDYGAEEVSDFFLQDIVLLAKESARLGIPLEINGETHHRIRVTNLPAPLTLLWAAYFIMKQYGASFVPGSDQHDFWIGRHGAYVPYDCFSAIGVTAEAIRFLTWPLFDDACCLHNFHPLV